MCCSVESWAVCAHVCNPKCCSTSGTTTTSPYITPSLFTSAQQFESLTCSTHFHSPPSITHTLHMCEKKNPQPTKCYSTLFFKVKDLKPSCWPPNAFGNKLGVRGLKFCIFNQAYSLMHPIWSGNKVILFTAHKVPTWIHYS